MWVDGECCVGDVCGQFLVNFDWCIDIFVVIDQGGWVGYLGQGVGLVFIYCFYENIVYVDFVVVNVVDIVILFFKCQQGCVRFCYGFVGFEFYVVLLVFQFLLG